MVTQKLTQIFKCMITFYFTVHTNCKLKCQYFNSNCVKNFLISYIYIIKQVLAFNQQYLEGQWKSKILDESKSRIYFTSIYFVNINKLKQTTRNGDLSHSHDSIFTHNHYYTKFTSLRFNGTLRNNQLNIVAFQIRPKTFIINKVNFANVV